MCRAAMLMLGLSTEAPPRAPREILTSPSDSRILIASRKVGRDTPNRAIGSASPVRESLISRIPRTIWLRSSLETSSAALGILTVDETLDEMLDETLTALLVLLLRAMHSLA